MFGTSLRSGAFSRVATASIAALSLLFAGDARADDTPPTDPSVTALDALVRASWRHDPETSSLAAQFDAAEHRARAVSRERGEISIDVGAGLMTMGDEMGPTWMLHASAGTEFIPRATRDANAEVVAAEAQWLMCATRAQALTLREQVEALVSEAQAIAETRAQTQTTVERLEALTRTVERQLAQGLGGSSALIRTQLELERATLDLHALDAQEQALLARARRLIPELADDALTIDGAWFESSRLPDDLRPQNNADAQLARLEADRLAAEQRVEEASRRIRWRVGGSYDRSAMMTGPDTMVPSHSLMANVGVSIPRTAAANARSEALRATAESVEMRARGEERSLQERWDARLAELELLEKQREALDERLAPLEAIAMRDYQRLLRSGGGDATELFELHRALSSLAQERIDIARAQRDALITLDRWSDGQISGRAPLLDDCGTAATTEASR